MLCLLDCHLQVGTVPFSTISKIRLNFFKLNLGHALSISTSRRVELRGTRKQIEQLLSTMQNHQAGIQQYHGQDLLQTWGTILSNHLLQTKSWLHGRSNPGLGARGMANGFT